MSTESRAKETTHAVHAVREFAEIIVLALIIVLVCKTLVFQTYRIPSESMVPTLYPGDQILVCKCSYGVPVPFTDVFIFGLREPSRGDVVVFKFPPDHRVHYIKRLVGMPGDTIEIKNKVLYVNGEVYDVAEAQYIDPLVMPGVVSRRDNYGPITIPPGAFFMMGDNRDNSNDSRFWGLVREHEIIGRTVMVYWCRDTGDGGFLGRPAHIRWDRIGTILVHR
ncbi:MAG: signal peptidase I [Deltaproteobacteria bacterium]|nr:signal peptidase I [Candidatus Zymogenaceae bacterium]